ncbi:LOW QUALITY PROTEIN: IQ and ubiquitin-like domain-containing protein [Octopus sinensis]|uniref:LOW QUALITY PROTEIN: IQ and ubiquitin-like domain-containing protein n=1 Tax=Octopus sinensis TaxID=2607531 RepID=A0A7E6EGI9_9MOLL|nr:LOW QUALITY PROTEIN: IQ and ubiquitin-like domain-containing protein [Octopus sinensis]
MLTRFPRFSVLSRAPIIIDPSKLDREEQKHKESRERRMAESNASFADPFNLKLAALWPNMKNKSYRQASLTDSIIYIDSEVWNLRHRSTEMVDHPNMEMIICADDILLMDLSMSKSILWKRTLGHIEDGLKIKACLYLLKKYCPGLAITIQKYVRRWLAAAYVEDLRRKRKEKLLWEEEIEKKIVFERDQKICKDYERRINPKTKEDFDLLYNLLEKWKAEQIKLITDQIPDIVDRKAHLYELNLQHVSLIQSIDRRRVAVLQEQKESNLQKLFNKAEPLKWKITSGGVCHVDNAYTIRARELNNIYSSLNLHYLTTDERLDILLTLKNTVSIFVYITWEYNSKLGREICNLADREASLLLREVEVSKLGGLRLRLSNLFARFLENPLFNPRISEFTKLEEPDFRHLIYNIWQSRSFFSSHKDIFDLCCIRWNKNMEWSPWNCLVVTKHEAVSHYRVTDIDQVVSN